MPSITTVKLTLSLVAALESQNGTLINHPVIRNPSSMHYGQAAQGVYGMMPKTTAEFGGNVAEAPYTLARYILRRNGGCPLKTAVIHWEQGQNIKATPEHWRKGTAPQRLERASKIWRGPLKCTKWYGKKFI